MISRKVTLLIICVSIIEIFFTIRIASLIGAGITIILFILTGTIGIKIMRHNTVNINNNINKEKNLGHVFLTILAGILLIIPGFLTDIIALIILIKPIRSAIINIIKNNIKNFSYETFSNFQTKKHKAKTEHIKQGDVIDAEHKVNKN